MIGLKDRTIVLPRNVKTYSTHWRARRYGWCSDPSPVRMPDGSTRWLAQPFFNARGGINMYTLEATA